MRARLQAKVRLKRASKIIENLTNLWEGAFFGIGGKDAFIFKDKCIKAAWVQGKKPDKEVRQLVGAIEDWTIKYVIQLKKMEA
ncbi:MAG: hypothetical protein LBD41_01250, partial [Clostridiales Family XIII bacterium]|nr:hypothetical protein [Clostridiales Family XIII bacterium]